jgi:hypothetical protein
MHLGKEMIGDATCTLVLWWLVVAARNSLAR